MTIVDTLLRASNAFGGPYKFLLMNLRGGQLVGAILAFACYAWLISTLTPKHLQVEPADGAIVGLGAWVSVYIVASMVAIGIAFQTAWCDWLNLVGDLLAVAGSVAVAVLTRESTGVCGGLFTGAMEEARVGAADVSQACKLQKVVFATGVCNSLMFFITFLLYAALKAGVLDRNAGTVTKQDSVDGHIESVGESVAVEKSSATE